MENGYLYVAVGKTEKFLKEAEISARSLRRFTKLPICLATNDSTYRSALYDEIFCRSDLGASYATKIRGLIHSPFSKKTVFLDSDTFVCGDIDDIFEYLDRFDLALALEPSGHTWGDTSRYPDFPHRMEGVCHEFHTGLIGYASRPKGIGFLDKWWETHQSLPFGFDMVTFREAFLDSDVQIGVLPSEYNFSGIHSFAIAHRPIKVVHGRFGETWNNLRCHMAGFDEMDRLARRLNRITYKRLIVPYLGVIPYNWNPFYIKRKIKQLLGVKENWKDLTY